MSRRHDDRLARILGGPVLWAGLAALTLFALGRIAPAPAHVTLSIPRVTRR